MSQILFKIGNSDYTQYVNKRKYKVNETDEINKWVDANHITHGDLIRTRISGSISLTFATVAEYNAFVTVANSAKGADGKYAVTIYVNRRNDTVTRNVFMTFTVSTVFTNNAYGENPAVFQVDIKLEEE